jgi:hypothetical protein
VSRSDDEVWILWHAPPAADEVGDYMLIGLYPTREAAVAAVDRLSGKPGFRDHPGIVEDTSDPGFFMEPHRLGEDHWTEGYRREDG